MIRADKLNASLSAIRLKTNPFRPAPCGKGILRSYTPKLFMSKYNECILLKYEKAHEAQYTNQYHLLMTRRHYGIVAVGNWTNTHFMIQHTKRNDAHWLDKVIAFKSISNLLSCYRALKRIVTECDFRLIGNVKPSIMGCNWNAEMETLIYDRVLTAA